jgi:hypothetical protein
VSLAVSCALDVVAFIVTSIVDERRKIDHEQMCGLKDNGYKNHIELCLH